MQVIARNGSNRKWNARKPSTSEENRSPRTVSQKKMEEWTRFDFYLRQFIQTNQGNPSLGKRDEAGSGCRPSEDHRECCLIEATEPWGYKMPAKEYYRTERTGGRQREPNTPCSVSNDRTRSGSSFPSSTLPHIGSLQPKHTSSMTERVTKGKITGGSQTSSFSRFWLQCSLRPPRTRLEVSDMMVKSLALFSRPCKASVLGADTRWHHCNVAQIRAQGSYLYEAVVAPRPSGTNSYGMIGR